MISSRRNREAIANQPILLLAIDIGTTFTAASYCIWRKDIEPIFQEVNRWPKQVSADAKVPSVLYYDHLGVARLHGAETEDEEALLEAEQLDWRRAEWWKIHLCPSYFPKPGDFSPPPLPDGVTVDVVFRDQLAYVLRNVHDFITRAHGSSKKHWDELASSMMVILTTPNGWEGRHRNQMREAAISAHLVGPDERNRVRFVSEGEAAIHYSLDYAKMNHSAKAGSNVLVCDAGGGTADIGVYKVNNLSPINLEEISKSRCVVAGGVFVNDAAEKFITNRLRGTKWDTPEYITSAVRTFERQVKRGFKGSEIFSFLKLDGSSSTDEAHGVVRGRLRIPRADMISFFEPSIRAIIEGLDATLSKDDETSNGGGRTQIFVVGGFAESDYVFSKLVQWADSHQLSVAKPDGVLSKAIAHGALSWHLHSGVQSRIAKLHYGAETNVEFKFGDQSMAGRKSYQNVHGEWRVRNAWNTIVRKNHRLQLGSDYSAWFHLDFYETDDRTVEMELFAYRFAEPPMFVKTKDGHLTEGIIHVGTVKGDLTKCYNAATYKVAPSKKKYKTLQYEVCLSFDEIEIKARLRWRERGVQVFGEATVSYDV